MKTTRTARKPSTLRESGGTFVDSTPINWWDTCAEILLVSLMAFMPLALGVVEPWSELVVLAASSTLAAVIGLRLIFHKKRRFAWSWTYLPVALFVLLAASHLVPLPAGWMTWLSSNTLATKAALLENASIGRDGNGTAISFYHQATVHALRLLLVPVALFIVTVNLVSRPDQLKRFLAAITLIGGAVATLALAQTFSGATEIYWTFPMPGSGVATGGPFVNRGHFAQFTNLSLGASIGLLLVVLREGDREEWGAWASRRLGRFGKLGSPVIGLLALIIVIQVLAVALSLSRGGALALLVALTVTVILLGLFGRVGRRGPWLAAILLTATAIAVYFGSDALYGRFSAAGSERFGDRDRMLHDLLGLFKQFPVFGTGLGTFQFVFPMVDTATLGLVATHAENEYAQILVEAGVVGLVVILWYIAVIGRHYFGAIKSSLPVATAGFGLGFGLLAAVVHSLSDFGQHVPAIGGLAAVYCGLLVCLTRMRREAAGTSVVEGTGSRRIGHRLRAVAGVAAMIGLAVAIGCTLPSADAARRAAAHWHRVTELEKVLAADAWNSGTVEDYATLIAEAGAAADLQPGDVTYRYGLNALRWRAVTRFHEPHSDSYEAYARRIVGELHQTHRLCPTYGPPVSLAGQIETFVLSDEAGPEHIRMGYRLAPTDAAACLAAGRLEVREGQWLASLDALRRAVKIDGRLLPEAINLYHIVADRPDLAMALIDGDPEELRSFALVLEQVPEPDTDGPPARPELALQARDRALALLKGRCAAASPTAGDLAALADMLQERGEFAAAVIEYRRALALSFDQVDWRFRLAKTLVAAGRPAEALREFESCVRQRPGWSEAEQLAEGLRATLEVPDGPSLKKP